MAGLSASGLKTQIRSYTETDSNVLSDSVLENIILNAQYRIFRDVPIDADRKQQLGNFVAGQESINCPAGAVFIRGIQVYDTAGSEITGANRWLEKKDVTYLQEYQDVTGTSAAQGQPKYYAMFGGATGESDTTSGRIFVAPTPNTTYRFRIHFNKMAGILEGDNAIKENRRIMGATDPTKAEDGTIRKKYGISIDKNSVHGSDSKENAKKEIEFFFKN